MLEFVPTGAEAISLDFSDNQVISTPVVNLSYTTTPPNAYVKCNYELYGSDATLNQSNNTLHASKNTAVILTVKAQCHNANGRELSESKLIVFDLYTAPYAVNIPNDRRCNWNQKHPGVTSLFGPSACTLVAGLDVANIYATNDTGYTPSDMVNYWTTYNRYTWEIPGSGRLSSYLIFDDVPDNVSSSLAAEYVRQCYICYIKNEIYNGRPVIVNLGPNVDNNHSVVAYKCMDMPVISRLGETPTEMNKIQVFDPENGGDVSDIEGRDVTLWEAFRFNFNAKETADFIIWSLRPTIPQ